jgi:hypothetical protein
MQESVNLLNKVLSEQDLDGEEQFCGAVIFAAFLLILGPLLFKAGPPRNRKTAQHMLYFSALGAGFLLLEIGLMQRLSMVFGNPGLSIGIVLAILISSTGIGSLISDRSFSRGLNFSKCVLFIIAYFSGYLFLVDSIVSSIIDWTLPEKIGAVAKLSRLWELPWDTCFHRAWSLQVKITSPTCPGAGQLTESPAPWLQALHHL